ncbi:6890_t:CDS:2 [Funneliformis geosporum]|uniref:6890_t:CDS:1 n=1 Tax=Funneliformis geosporum TaxID=1117311 RepID=A0A9W4SV34_9GLOM|nr:6890_t:CDS:2 [Funneliformis geosporum]
MKVGQLKYINSMQFMNSSLASLTKNLGNKHPIMTEYLKKQSYFSEQISLAYHKGIFPHEYIDSHDRFKETELPLINEFHSIFGGEYNDLYLKIDILSLADV